MKHRPQQVTSEVFVRGSVMVESVYVMCHDLFWQHQYVLECRNSSWCLHCNYPMLPDPNTHHTYMYYATTL